MNRVLVCFLLLLYNSFLADGQIITTVAGSGLFGSTPTGDGGTATMAGIHIPGGLTVDGLGNLYISTQGRIRKVDASGMINSVAGGGTIIADGIPATDASIISLGVTVDAVGNLYIVSHNLIHKVDVSGIFTTIAGDGSGYTGDGGPATAAGVNGSYDLSFDNAGNLYITNVHHVRKINGAGIISTFAGNNTLGYSGDGGPALAAQVNRIGGITADASGNVYFADMNNRVIRKVSTEGTISTFAGTGVSGYSGDGGLASAATFQRPYDIAFDRWGNMVVSDPYSNVVRRINPSGIITTIAGTGTIGFSGDGGPAILAEFHGPESIAIDSVGNIYIGDHSNYRVRKISTYNRAPYFTLGSTCTFTACGGFNVTDTLLRTVDSNSTQQITWSVLVPPAHGAATVAYTNTSTGGVLTPVGTGYTPSAGYIGSDTYTVRVTDGPTSDTITILVDVHPTMIAAPITGSDIICVGSSATLSGASPGGTWSSTDATVGVGAGTGVVTGVSIGTATITYAVSNFCGAATATHVVTILPEGECPTGVAEIAANTISIFPNPNTGSFTIQLPPGAESRITITDVTGRKIMQLMGAASCPCALPAGCSGVYFAEVVNGSGRWYGKVVVQ